MEEGTTYIQVLEMLGINPETAIVIRDNLPTPADEAIEEGSIKILRVISGG